MEEGDWIAYTIIACGLSVLIFFMGFGIGREGSRPTKWIRTDKGVVCVVIHGDLYCEKS